MKKLIASAMLAAAATAFGAAMLAADATAQENDERGAMMAPGYGHGPGMMPGMMMEPGCGYGQGSMMGPGYGYGHGPMMGYRQMPQMPQMPMHGFRYHMQMIDQDNDGIVSQDEAAARHERIFETLDSDDDGALSEEEFVYAPMGRRPGVALDDPRWQRRHQHRHARFEALDGDDDGKISQIEFMVAGAERFAGADLDGDGKVTVWEFRSRRRAN